MVPLCPKKYLPWSRFACMLRSRCLLPSPRAAPSSKLSPLYVPVSPVSRVERCKPCPVARVPTLGCSWPLPPNLSSCWHPLCPVCPEIYYRDMSICLRKNGPYIRTRLVTPQEKYKHTGSTTPSDGFFRSCLDKRPPAQAVLPLCVCTHVHAPTWRSGAEPAQAARPQTPH